MRDANLTPTGRELKDPAATLVECADPEGLKHTVIAFDEAFVGHEALTTGVDLIMSFMAYPMVTGLVECNAADTARARYAYPTGTIWTVKEIMRSFEQLGQRIGARAALEMCYLAGMVLNEAGETGPLQGCFSHGNLNPWRIGLKADGQLQVFGYGLAQVEMSTFLAGTTPHIDPDSIRYAPPERLEQQPEQPSSDTYSLTLVAYEMIVGKPLYDETDPEAMWNAVKLAKGVARIAESPLPDPLKETFGAALLYDPDRRLHGQAYVEAVGELLDDPRTEGRTLSELMTRMSNKEDGQGKRKLVKAKETSTFTPDDLARIAAQSGSDGADLDADAPEKRWSSLKAATTGRRTRRAEASSTPPRKPTEATAPRRGRKPRKVEVPKADAPTTAKLEEPTAPATEGEDQTRRRRRSKTADTPEPTAKASAVPEVEAEAETPRRRRRRRTTTEETRTDDTATEAPPPDSAETPRRRRRRTKSTGSENEQDDTASGDATPPSTGAPSPSDEPATPPRRRRRRKSATPQPGPEDTPEDVEPEDDAPTDAIQVPRRRRRRRKPEEEGD